MGWESIPNALADAGKTGLENLINTATLGDDTARQIALARERADWNAVNGSGAPDTAGNLQDAKAGKSWWNRSLGWLAPEGSTFPPILLIVIGGVLYFVAKKLR